MKKFLFLFLTVFSFILCSCESDEHNAELRSERLSLESQIRSKKATVNSLVNTRDNLTSEVNTLKQERGILKSGKTPKYFVCIKIHQSTMTLDIGEHIKNQMNDIKIWLETSESNYKKSHIGDRISSDFKSGSFWIDGDISHLKITVCDKKIE